MSTRPDPSRFVQTLAIVCLFALTVMACSSDNESAAPNVAVAVDSGVNTEPAGSSAVSPNPAQTPANGTAAPRRSFKPVFTGEAAQVEKAFRSNLDAFARKDLDAAMAMAVKSDELVGTREGLLNFMNTYRIVLYRINNIVVTGDTAAIDYENAIVGRTLKSDITTLLAQHDVWQKQLGAWKFVSDVSSMPGIPGDLPSVKVTLRDGAQTVVASPLPSGEFAFSLSNTGTAAKGVFILGIPSDLDVPSYIQLFKSADRLPLPDRVLELGGIPDMAPAGKGAMVFSGALPKGRYLLLSRAKGEGDVLSKEYAEFTI